MRMKARTKKSAQSRSWINRKRIVRVVQSLSTRTKVVALIAVLSTPILIGGAMARSQQEALFAHTVTTPPQTPIAAPRVEPPAAVAAAAVDAPIAEQKPKLAAVTITGCLERNDETFRLKDTAGESAPKARSWKSGFFKKSAASIAVIDAGNRVKLPAHVGQRVSVTGTLVDREMQVRSLQRVAASCSVKS